jgi:hypothetical protein
MRGCLCARCMGMNQRNKNTMLRVQNSAHEFIYQAKVNQVLVNVYLGL